MNKTTSHSLLLILAAFIWGVAFVAQSAGGDAVGALSFNCVRSIIGAIVLLPVISVFDRIGSGEHIPRTQKQKKDLWIAGLTCGIALFIASNLQQLGITMGTPAGKAGFLTSTYIVLVPVFGIFLKRRCGWNVWVSVVLALTGLWLLCMQGSFSLTPSDLLLIGCAIAFTVQILAIDHFVGRVDSIRLSSRQFLVAGLLTIPFVIIFEIPKAGGFGPWLQLFLVPSAWLPILYAGVCSSGIAYTLQIVGQQHLHPAIASVLMSLESVFSLLAGWVLLHQVLSTRELLGCAVIFAAVILAQLPFGDNN